MRRNDRPPLQPLVPITWARVATAVAAVAGVAGPVAATEPLRDLDVHGTTLRAACRADAWRDARAEIERAAGARDPAALVAYARALLCGEGPADAARVLATAPRRIVDVSVGTGQPPQRSRVDAAEALAPRAGAAWALQVQADGDAVRLQWHANEACVHGVRLRHQGRAGWRTAETGSACD